MLKFEHAKNNHVVCVDIVVVIIDKILMTK